LVGADELIDGSDLMEAERHGQLNRVECRQLTGHPVLADEGTGKQQYRGIRSGPLALAR